MLSRRHSFAVGLVFSLAGCQDNSPLMTPGQDCYPCHAPENGRRGFPIAGTVFPSPTASESQGLQDAVVLVTDAHGNTLSLQANAAGNFYTERAVAFPVTVAVQLNGITRHMEPTTTDGSCNHCHDQPPSQGAEGRVYVPTAP